jgi:hypothetical protein
LVEQAIDLAQAPHRGFVGVGGEAVVDAQDCAALRQVAVKGMVDLGVPVERLRRDVEAGGDFVGLRLVGGCGRARIKQRRGWGSQPCKTFAPAERAHDVPSAICTVHPMRS